MADPKDLALSYLKALMMPAMPSSSSTDSIGRAVFWRCAKIDLPTPVVSLAVVVLAAEDSVEALAAAVALVVAAGLAGSVVVGGTVVPVAALMPALVIPGAVDMAVVLLRPLTLLPTTPRPAPNAARSFLSET